MPASTDDLAHAEHARHDAHRGAAGQEVAHHLRGDRLRITGHPLRDHAVIAGRDDHRRAPDDGPFGAEDAREPDRHLLDPAQAARRLGQGQVPGLGAPHRIGVCRPDALKGRGQRHEADEGGAGPTRWTCGTPVSGSCSTVASTPNTCRKRSGVNTSAGVPSATSSPLDSSASRSQYLLASHTSCSATTAAMPAPATSARNVSMAASWCRRSRPATGSSSSRTRAC